MPCAPSLRGKRFARQGGESEREDPREWEGRERQDVDSILSKLCPRQTNARKRSITAFRGRRGSRLQVGNCHGTQQMPQCCSAVQLCCLVAPCSVAAGLNGIQVRSQAESDLKEGLRPWAPVRQKPASVGSSFNLAIGQLGTTFHSGVWTLRLRKERTYLM
jgi:hypothetical protein